MVPVGGSIVASIVDSKFIDELATIYPGRASVSPILDLFITLLEMGKNKWNSMRMEQQENLIYFKELLDKVFNDKDDEKVGIENIEDTKKDDLVMIKEKVLYTPNNPISIGLTLNTLYCDDKNIKQVTKLGSMLFSRCVSGARIVVPGMKKKVVHFEFDNYGGHIGGGYHSPYITITSSIGMTKNDINQFVYRLLKCYHQLLKIKNSKNQIIMDKHMLSLKQNNITTEDISKPKKQSGSDHIYQEYFTKNRKSKSTKKKQTTTKKQKDKPSYFALNTDKSLSHLLIGISIGIVTGIIMTKSMARNDKSQ